jgi:hypothetical protein
MPNCVRADAREVLSSIKDRVPWALKFHEELVNFPAAKKAFERLIATGCDPGDLLFWLDFCCCDYQTRHAKDEREIGQEIALFGRRLLDNAKQLQKFEASRRREILKALQLPEFQSLSVRLQAYAQCLMDEASELKKQGVPVREAPGLATGWLAARVEGSTDGTHYSEIARIMEAHYSMRDIRKDISSRAVEKQVKRFRRRHPLAYSHIKNMASRQYGALRGEYIPWSNNVTLKK